MKTNVMYIRKVSFLVIFLFFVLCITGCRIFTQEKKVLFIGNSLFYTNDLPLTFENLAKSMGKKVLVSSSTAPNYRLIDHARSEETEQAIQSEKWDFVLVNENNMVLMDDTRHMAELYPGMEKLVEQLSANGLTMSLMINWAFRDGLFLPGMDTYDKMQDYLISLCDTLVTRFSVGLFPAGPVWREVRRKHPEISLWGGDVKYPNANGTYLTACALYSYIFRESAAGSKYLVFGVKPEEAHIFQEIAFETIIKYLNGR